MRPPKIPRCLCSTELDYKNQIMSPSLYFDKLWKGNDKEANKYFIKLDKYFKQTKKADIESHAKDTTLTLQGG